ncbi:hypothetical protein GCM10009535_17490 [Streptomyces thermocarboxydovorans]|uniref:Uncharacterized protein n=1 Tax=Streptomyces thermocarboxydovorans TaxID=59298 RepID=A0ABP3SI82_9ACTN
MKGGTGLGRALVQRLARASGGEAALRAAATGGLDAVISLPSASPPESLGASDGSGSRPRERPALPA